MKIRFIDEYSNEFSVSESNTPPQIGSNILFDDEIYIVENVYYDPLASTTTVLLSQKFNKKENKLLENSDKSLENLVKSLNKTVGDLTKEIKSLKNEIQNIKQYIKSSTKR